VRELVQVHGHDQAVVHRLDAAKGWAAGLTLMLLSHRPDDPWFEQAARERLFDYFASEVLLRLPPTEQRTLSLLAYLPSMSAELAVAMSEDPSAPQLLERLAAASAFTDRREGSTRGYELHALFADFLRRQYERQHGSAAALEQLSRAGRLLADAGEWDAALQRLIEARAWEDVRCCVERAAPYYVEAGRQLALARHLASTPEDDDVSLTYWRGFCKVEVEPLAALEHFKRAAALADAARDSSRVLEVIAGAAAALALSGQIAALGPWIDRLDALVERDPDHGRSVLERSLEIRVVPGVLAALVYARPWHPLTAHFADRAERLLLRGVAAGQQLTFGSLTLYLVWVGQLDRVSAVIARVDAMVRQGLAAPTTLIRWWKLGALAKIFLGETASLASDIRQGLDLIDGEPALEPHRARFECDAVLATLAMGDLEQARRHLRRASLATDRSRPIERTVFEHVSGVLALQEEDPDAALALMRAAATGARRHGLAFSEHMALMGVAVAAAASGNAAEAEAILGEIWASPFFPVCRLHQWIGGMVAAYASERGGNRDMALRRLADALRVARSHGYRFDPSLQAVKDLLPCLTSLALQNSIEPAVARDLIRRHQLKAPSDADDSWLWPVRVSLLGGYVLSIDGTAPRPSRKESRRLVQFLLLLAAHSAIPIPLDRVEDLLWPDADGDAARNALENALHRLRKTLGGEDRVLLRNSMLLLNPDRCWVDVRALEHLLSEIEVAPTPLLPGLSNALRRRYTAPLLPDDQSPAIAARRVALHRHVQRVGHRVVERLAAANLDSSPLCDWLDDRNRDLCASNGV
jgi:LuxR family transcriptional regulator, maltose regulon positive regulatory protein